MSRLAVLVFRRTPACVGLPRVPIDPEKFMSSSRSSPPHETTETARAVVELLVSVPGYAILALPPLTLKIGPVAAAVVVMVLSEPAVNTASVDGPSPTLTRDTPVVGVFVLLIRTRSRLAVRFERSTAGPPVASMMPTPDVTETRVPVPAAPLTAPVPV